jgi:hypothetical protein
MLYEPLSAKYEIVGAKFGNEEVLSGLFILIELQVQLDDLLNSLIRLTVKSL